MIKTAKLALLHLLAGGTLAGKIILTPFRWAGFVLRSVFRFIWKIIRWPVIIASGFVIAVIIITMVIILLPCRDADIIVENFSGRLVEDMQLSFCDQPLWQGTLQSGETIHFEKSPKNCSTGAVLASSSFPAVELTKGLFPYRSACSGEYRLTLLPDGNQKTSFTLGRGCGNLAASENPCKAIGNISAFIDFLRCRELSDILNIISSSYTW